MLTSREGIPGIVFLHQTSGPITGWAYKQEAFNQDFTVLSLYK